MAIEPKARPLDTILLYFLRPIFSLGARLYLHICLPWRLTALIVLCVAILAIFTIRRCGLVRRALQSGVLGDAPVCFLTHVCSPRKLTPGSKVGQFWASLG